MPFAALRMPAHDQRALCRRDVPRRRQIRHGVGGAEQRADRLGRERQDVAAAHPGIVLARALERNVSPGHVARMGPPVARILETSLYVGDLGVSEAFYERVFGFTQLRRDERMCAMAVPGRQVLLLFLAGASTAPSQTPGGFIPAHEGAGHLHLCFSIGTDDVERWRAHLLGNNIAIESEIRWPLGGTSVYFRDPDGHSLEVATPGLWANDP